MGINLAKHQLLSTEVQFKFFFSRISKDLVHFVTSLESEQNDYIQYALKTCHYLCQACENCEACVSVCLIMKSILLLKSSYMHLTAL